MRLAFAAVVLSMVVLVGVAAIAHREARSSMAAKEHPDNGPFRGSETPARIRMPAFSLHE
jgi:hypothetical protein